MGTKRPNGFRRESVVDPSLPLRPPAGEGILDRVVDDPRRFRVRAV